MRNSIIAFLSISLVGCIGWYVFFGPGVLPPPTIASANQAFEEGDFATALVEADQLLSARPTSAPLLMMAAESATKLEMFDQAIDYYARIPRSATEWATSRWAMSEIFYHIGQATKAVDSASAALDKDPEFVLAHERMIGLLSTFGRRRETLPHLMFMIRSNRLTVEYLLLVGNLAKENEIMPELQRCKQAAPLDPLPDLGLASSAYTRGEFDEARALVETVIPKANEISAAHALLGFILLETSPDELKAWNAKLPASAETDPDIWYIRGQWLRTAYPEQAIRCFAEAIRLDANHVKAHQSMAQWLARVGKAELAQPFADKAEKLQTINADLEQIYKARNFTPTIKEVAELTLELGRLWEAIGWSLFAQSADPTITWPKEVAERAQSATNFSVNTPHTLPSANLVVGASWVNEFPKPDFSQLGKEQIANSPGDEASIQSVAQFVERTAPSGLNFQFDNNTNGAVDGHRIFETTGAGIGILDFDADGWPDVFFVQGGDFPPAENNATHQDQLFRNLSQGEELRFESATLQSRLQDFAFGQGIAVADVNCDGFDDIYVCNIGPNQLWLNCGDGTFENGNSRIPADQAWTSSAAIADLNLDGFPEIYDANYVQGDDVFTRLCTVGGKERSCSPLTFSPTTDRVLTPTEQGTFKPVNCDAMVANGLGVVVFRLAGHDYPSIFVAADQQANLMGNVIAGSSASEFQIENDAVVQGVAFDSSGRAQACMGIAAGDANSDGEVDLFVTNFYDEYYTLFVQDGGFFTDVTARSGTIGATKPLLGFGAQFLDANLDGFQDLFVLNGHIDDHTHIGIIEQMPPQFFLGLGEGKFELVDAEVVGPFFSSLRLGRALAKFDVDQNGLCDLVCGDLESPASLVENVSNPVGSSLTLRLVGTESERNAFCSEATLSCSAAGKMHSQKLQLISGGGYQASNERSLQFTVPPNASKLTLSIVWPSGKVEQYDNLAGRSYIAVEGHALTEILR